MPEIIDAHTHIWTPDTAKYPLGPGYTRADMQPPSFTPEEFLKHAEPEGVKRAVLIQMSFYSQAKPGSPDEKSGYRTTVLDNRYLLDSMKRFPGRFGAVGIVDWTAPRPDEDMAKLGKEGVRGFRVRPGNAPLERWIETESFRRMFAYAAEHEMAICPLIDPNALPSLARMCERFPRTRVVIDHLCRIGASGEIHGEDVAALTGMARFPEVRVKVSAFYALGKKRPPHDDLEPLVRRVYDAFGAKRLMWASDCPFAVVDETYRDSLSLVRDRCPWLPAEDREWLLARTAAGVFF